MISKIILRSFLIVILLTGGVTAFAQTTAPDGDNSKKEETMKTYLIERDIPGASKFTPVELKGISQKSCTVLKEMGNSIKWIQSYVAGDKIFCVYQATNESLLREHAQKGGFPVTKITQVANIISPASAE